MRVFLYAPAAFCGLAAACSGVAYNTTVADTPAARFAMAQSVTPGGTTEQAFVTRWGPPVQKVRDGAQTEFIYRNMHVPVWHRFPQFGDSERYVIVTFQYGLATGVRTSDGIACRASFNPRPPNYSFDLPVQIGLSGTCPLTGLWSNGASGQQTMVTDDASRLPGAGDAPK